MSALLPGRTSSAGDDTGDRGPPSRLKYPYLGILKLGNVGDRPETGDGKLEYVCFVLNGSYDWESNEIWLRSMPECFAH